MMSPTQYFVTDTGYYSVRVFEYETNHSPPTLDSVYRSYLAEVLLGPHGIAQHPISGDLYVSVSCGVNVIEYLNWGHVKIVIGAPADYGLQDGDFNVCRPIRDCVHQ